VLEQQPHDRFGQHDEQDGGDQVQENQRAQPVPQRGAKFANIFFRRQPGKRRQQIRRQRNAEHALRQFHQAHRVVERRDDLRADPERDGFAPAAR
jgi:epoxyqueuosine reductase QueG